MTIITHSGVVEGVRKVWERYPNINDLGSRGMCVEILHLAFPNLWSNEIEELIKDIRECLDEEVREGRMFFIPNGRDFGFYRSEKYYLEALQRKQERAAQSANQATLTGLTNYVLEVFKTIPSDKPEVQTSAINNHTCPSCGNDRCSKTEKSCWKCGGKL